MDIKVHGIHHAEHIIEHLSPETEKYIFNSKVRILPLKIKLAKKIILRNKKYTFDSSSIFQLTKPLINLFIGNFDTNTEKWKALYDNKFYEIVSK